MRVGVAIATFGPEAESTSQHFLFLLSSRILDRFLPPPGVELGSLDCQASVFTAPAELVDILRVTGGQEDRDVEVSLDVRMWSPEMKKNENEVNLLRNLRDTFYH